MGPPACGTPAYEDYLLRQRERKQTQRDRANVELKRKEAKPFVSAAVRATNTKWREVVDTERRMTTRLLRENTSLKYANDQLLEGNKSLETKQQAAVRKLKEGAEDLKRKNQEQEKELQRLKKRARRADEWDVWWRNVKSRASPAFFTKLGELGRPAKRAADHGWGGGQ